MAHSGCARSAGFGTLRRYHQRKRYLAGTSGCLVFSALVFSQLSIAGREGGDSGSDLDGRGPTRAHKNIVICGVRGGALSHGVFGCSCPWCLDTTSSDAPMHQHAHFHRENEQKKSTGVAYTTKTLNKMLAQFTGRSTVPRVLWRCPQHENTMTLLTLNTITRSTVDYSIFLLNV